MLRKIGKYQAPWWMSGEVTMVLSLASSVAVLVLILLYWLSCDEKVKLTEKLDFSTKTAFASVAIISVFVAYQTLRLNIHKEQLKAAFDLLTRFDKEEEKEARDRIDDLFRRTGELREYLNDAVPPDRMTGFIAALKAEDKEAIRVVISFFEDVALSVRAGYAHEGVTFRALGPVAIRYINGLRPYIQDVHRDTGETLYYDDSLHLLRYWKHHCSAR